MQRTYSIPEVLAAVNDLRAAHGLDEIDEMPMGIPGRASACPLKHALGELCSTVGVESYNYNGTFHTLPKRLETFRTEFDWLWADADGTFHNSGYPELDASSYPELVGL
ncbi:MAG: hypothetical protein ACXVHB_06060 [Solirubrobacteraceae bacterium]